MGWGILPFYSSCDKKNASISDCLEDLLYVYNIIDIDIYNIVDLNNAVSGRRIEQSMTLFDAST